MQKKGVKVAVIVLALFAAGLATCIVARHVAIDQVSRKVLARLDGTGASFDVDAGHAFWCIESARLEASEHGVVGVEGLCLENPLSALWGEAVEVSAGRVRVELEYSEIGAMRDIAASFRSKLAGAGGENAKKSSNTRAYRGKASEVEIFMRHGDEMAFSLRGRDMTGFMSGGEAEVRGVFSHSLTGRRLPFSIDSMPTISVTARYDRGKKTGEVIAEFEPALSASFAKGGQAFSCSASSSEVGWNGDEVRVSLGGFSLAPSQGAVLPPVVMAGEPRREAGVGAESKTPKLTAQAVSISLPVGKFRVSDIAAVQIDRPRLSVELSEVLALPVVKDNAIVSAFVQFWKQDAGAFLGEAPRLSVRREDVKKNKPRIEKKPLPKETLEKWRAGMEKFGDRVRALPAIDIREGEISVSHGKDRFELDAISVNTSKLFKESQDFEIHFDVRGADVMFGVSYPKDEELPRFVLRASELGAPDFLRVLNLPIPERNSGDVTFDVGVSFSDEALSFEGSFALRDFSFYHEKISPNVIEEIDLKASIRAAYRFADDLVTVDPIRIDMGPLKVHGVVKVEALRNQPVIDFKFTSEKLACEALSQVIPKGFLPTITSLSFEGGEISPTISGRIPWRYPLTATLEATGFEGKCLPILVEPHHPEIIAGKDYTHTTTYTYFVESITVGPGTSSYVPLSQIPPYVKAAMLLTEDKRFYEHGPLRVSFIERALRLNLNARRYVYGGSTIGQQLVKNLFLRRTKNIARKLEEALITWHMETYVAKSRIFELYMNVIEFGPDVYGIEQGAQFYFGKHARDLTPLEGAYLASLKVSPSKGGGFYKRGFPKSGSWWERRLKYILKVLAVNGYVSPLEVIAAYDWRPEFAYPDDPKDWRAEWLENYGKYLRDGDKALKRGAQGADMDPSKGGGSAKIGDK